MKRKKRSAEERLSARRKAQRKYREANRDKLHEANRVYYKNNKDEANERHKLRVLADPDKYERIRQEKNAKARKNSKARWKEYYQKHQAELQERSRSFSRRNKEKVSGWLKRWQMANPETVRAGYAKKRARKRGATIGNTKVIEQWLTRVRKKKKVRCYHCNVFIRGKEIHADHLTALAKGGSHELGNIVASCSSCNLRKNAKSIAEWNKQLLQPVLPL